MKHNFDEIIDRHNTDCYKWDSAADSEVLPLWVADMDFRCAPAITEALRARIDHPIFGYVSVPDSYYHSIIQWFQRRHGFAMEKEWMIYTSGVVPAVSAIIKALTKPGDKVLVLTPVYNCFFSSIRNNDCIAEEIALVRENDTYKIDFEAFEKQAAQANASVFLLCNPHNPAGRVWTKDELQTLGDICIRHNVFVIADEIHCELTMPGYTYTPFASISTAFLNHSATCTSASKAFNIAGLQNAVITVADSAIRGRINKAININEVCDVNMFGVVATQAAYNHSEDWLEELRAYIYNNYVFAKQRIETSLPQLKVMKLEGTYLLWVDIQAITRNSKMFCDQLKSQGKVWFSPGIIYGEAGEGFMRINLACPKATLQEALARLETFVRSETL